MSRANSIRSERVSEHERLDEQRLRLLVESVRDYAIFMVDPAGRVVSWNRGAQRIKGYTEEEILGRHFSVFYTPEDLTRDWPAQELERAKRHGSFEDPGWRLRKDGDRFWAHVLITAVHDEDGELVGFAEVTRDMTERREAQIAAFHDITERRRAAEELSERERPLRAVLDVLPLPVFIAEASGQLSMVNAAFRAFWGEDLVTPSSTAEYGAFRGWWPDTGKRLDAHPTSTTCSSRSS